MRQRFENWEHYRRGPRWIGPYKNVSKRHDHSEHPPFVAVINPQPYCVDVDMVVALHLRLIISPVHIERDFGVRAYG